MFTLGRDMDLHYKTNQLITGLLILTAASAVNTSHSG